MIKEIESLLESSIKFYSDYILRKEMENTLYRSQYTYRKCNSLIVISSLFCEG